ncbi:MAG: UDP-N-acetylmuramoyl-L-alanine--D-glutamate ligase [Reichenbachiella sp.]
MGALRLSVKQGLSCFLSDFSHLKKELKEEVISLGMDFEEDGHTIDKLKEFGTVVKSPGIPETAPIISQLRAEGISVISEIEFASRYTNANIIGITGSNGKTTTTLLTTHLLKQSGINVVSAGNVGNSLSNLLMEEAPEVIVLELSSFQLDDIAGFRPNIGIILNITADHLDRYEYDMSKYADAKFNLAKYMTFDHLLILNADDELSHERVGQVNPQVQEISILRKVNEGAYLDGEYLVFDNEKSLQVIDVHNLPLLGKHNYYNQMAAILVAIELGVSLEQILTGLKTFKNVEHRLEIVTEVEGVLFINDSKATNVDAVYYALEAMDRSIVWIAGGINKGNDYTQIKQLVKEKVKNLVCLGKDNRHLINEFSQDVNKYNEVSSADEAVDIAFELANPGDVVLLSPACASFDLFKNYEERGDLFKKAVLRLKKKESNQVEA